MKTCWDCKHFNHMGGHGSSEWGSCSLLHKNVDSDNSCDKFVEQKLPILNYMKDEISIQIKKSKFRKFVNVEDVRDFVDIDGYEVNSYKCGELIEKDKRYFSEKDKAGLYALGLEGYYKFYKDDE